MWKIEKSRRGTYTARIPLIAVIAMIFAIVGLTIVLWSAQRGATAHDQLRGEPGRRADRRDERTERSDAV